MHQSALRQNNWEQNERCLRQTLVTAVSPQLYTNSLEWPDWCEPIWFDLRRWDFHAFIMYISTRILIYKKKNSLVIYLPHRNFSLRLCSQCRQIWFAFQIQTLGMSFCKWIKLGLFVHTVYSISNITTGVAVLMIETILSWEELSVWKVSTENSTFYLRLYLAG